MFKKILLLSTTLLLLFSCGGAPMNTEAETKQENSYLPLVTTPVPPVYLPLIMKPWLNSTFGVEVSYLNETVAARAKETRSAWVRINALHWAAYQPNNSSEFITNLALEQELILADQNGMEAILIIHRTPEWAREYPDSVCGPIRSDKLVDFANFMKMVVQKYSQPPYNVMHYEFWNEPDHPVVRDKPDTSYNESNIPYGCWGDNTLPYFGGGYYAEMLKVVYPAIKAANSEAQLILGGLLLDCDPRFGYGDDKPCKSETLMNMSTFFEGVLDNDGGNYFDIVNFHGYNYYAPLISPIQREYEIPNWAENGGQVEGKVAFLQEVMSRYDISKPIILTEAGLIYGNSDVFPPDYELGKAEYVVWLYVRNWAKGLMATTWYTLDKGGWRGTGLLDAQNNPTQSFYAYKTMTETLYGANYVKEVSTETDMTVFEFEKGYRIWVLFSMDGEQKSIDLPLDGYSFEAIDLFGNVCDGTTDCQLGSEKISFDLPVFLKFSVQD